MFDISSAASGLLLGLVVGSFCTVVYHRWSRGESIAAPRSHCPACSHVLGPADLVPVLSFVFARGRCRYCREPISWFYPALELMSGLITALTCGLVGLPLGLLVLLAPFLFATLLAKRRRSSVPAQRASEGGFTLVEVLLSLLLLSLTVVSVFDTIRMARWSAVAAQRRTVAVNLAREGLARAAATARQLASDQDLQAESWSWDDYDVTVFPQLHTTPNAWWVTVQVSCPRCHSIGPKGTDVKITGVVRR